MSNDELVKGIKEKCNALVDSITKINEKGAHIIEVTRSSLFSPKGNTKEIEALKEQLELEVKAYKILKDFRNFLDKVIPISDSIINKVKGFLKEEDNNEC